MNPRFVPVLFLAFLAALTVDVRSQARWAHDGKHVEYAGAWHDPATWQKVEPTAPPKADAPKDDAIRLFLEALEAARGGPVSPSKMKANARRSTLPRAPVDNPGALVSADRKVVAAGFDGELWAWRRDGKATRLSTTVAAMRHFYMPPTGNAVSYIQDNNLYVVETLSGKTHKLTDDGGENTFNGELDWVYQEEVYGRFDFQATWWAPDGRHVAFMRIDENGVDTFSVVDHIPNQLQVEQLKYPKAGRINPRATLKVATSGGEVVDVDLSKYSEKDEILIVRVGWTPKGDKLVYMVQNREQTWLDLNFADPATGKPRTVIHESSSDSWVERLPMPRWLGDGSFVWESDRSGYRHYYRYDASGKLLNPISAGPFSASDVIEVDEENGWMAFYGTTEDYSIGRHAYQAKLDGSALHQVTKGRGMHTVSFNGDGSMVLDSFSSLENPGEQWLRKSDGTDIRKVSEERKPRGATFTQWKQIKARDGETLDITYTLPRDFDPNQKYPVWIDTYSGPAAPNILDTWQGPARGAWFVLLSVNVRSASLRGMKYTSKCYKQFGVQELKDIEDAVDWICQHPWADAERVGISGWSYGGFMTAFALTHSKKFKCGIAGAGVYDWRLYDTIYTERYMQTPQNNPEGYRSSSVVEAAADLHGELLIVHGTMDDNVHMQNAIQFVHALQQAGKTNFQFMLYPRSRHGVGSSHLGQLRLKFMRNNL